MGNQPNGAKLGFENELWRAADAMRSNMDAAEYKHIVLGLIFLKYISDAFEEPAEGLNLNSRSLAAVDAWRRGSKLFWLWDQEGIRDPNSRDGRAVLEVFPCIDPLLAACLTSSIRCSSALSIMHLSLFISSRVNVPHQRPIHRASASTPDLNHQYHSELHRLLLNVRYSFSA